MQGVRAPLSVGIRQRNWRRSCEMTIAGQIGNGRDFKEVGVGVTNLMPALVGGAGLVGGALILLSEYAGLGSGSLLEQMDDFNEADGVRLAYKPVASAAAAGSAEDAGILEGQQDLSQIISRDFGFIGEFLADHGGFGRLGGQLG